MNLCIFKKVKERCQEGETNSLSSQNEVAGFLRLKERS